MAGDPQRKAENDTMTWTLSAFADEAGPTCDAQIEALKKAGLTHVDLRSVDEHNICALPAKNAKQIRRKLDEAGIQVLMFGSPIGKIDIADDFQIDLERLAHLGRLRPILGCSNVRLFSYYNKNGADAATWQKEALERLGLLRDRARKLGLVLYHENERLIFGDRCPEIQVLAEQLRDEETFRLIFDFDNFNQSGDDVWNNWQKLRDCTDAFHLKDSDDQNRHVPVGCGQGRVREILADATRRGWTGPLSIEPHLGRSKAVMATGPHGNPDESFANMSEAQSFHVAATTAVELVREVS